MSPLQIYRASAGSGKTYSLTLEYLRLLFRFPGIHRHILAVTFTNKAAGEMKHRILSRLHALSCQDGSSTPPEMVRLKEWTGWNEEEIRDKATQLLNQLLNDYSGFFVGTIDKFFQSVIRAFTREVGIQPGYNLELDNSRLLSLAVDRLFHDITDNEELQQWLIRFAEERIEEARSWNFREDIMQLGMQLFREVFQNLFLVKDLSVLGKEKLDQFIEETEKVAHEAKREMIRTGSAAMEGMKQKGFEVADFRLKEKSVPSLFRDASEGRELNFTDARINAIDDRSKWLSRNADEDMLSFTEHTLMPYLSELFTQQVILNTISAIRKNYYTMGILGDLWERIDRYKREQNIFLISDSSRFLRGIIRGDQVPFVYERTGNRFSHLMLDEFQDTSRFQYDNFMPLLDNSLAAGHESLVVGDVKQSIYRWRNSDWKILSSDIEKDFRHQRVLIRTLSTNYRSREQIILFNNTFFQIAAGILSEKIGEELLSSPVDREEAKFQVEQFREAYSDAVQKVPEEKRGSGGLVRVKFLAEQGDRDFQEEVLTMLPEWLEDIGRTGIEPGETAILVRSRKEGVRVANRLLQYAGESGGKIEFRLISNESLLLVHNPSVTLLVSVIQFLVTPGDQLNNALLKYHCFLSGLLSTYSVDTLFDSSIPVEEILPEELTAQLQILKQMPLFELVETLITLLGMERKTEDVPYLQAFQDLILDLQRRESSGLTSFLRYWKDQGAKHGVSLAETSNAIRILTIHKAKGLEFKAVVVPFCNWEITSDPRKSGILWCDTAYTPFNRIPVVPVNFNGTLRCTLFSAAYYQERMKGYMDNLNLAYVAFTRARDLLMIGVPDPEQPSLKTAGDLLRESLCHEPSMPPCLEGWSGFRKEDQVNIGWLPSLQKEPPEKHVWVFDGYPVNRIQHSMKVRLRSDEFFLDEEGKFVTAPSYGNIMHMLFSRIISKSDLEKVLDNFRDEGIIPGREIQKLMEEISDMLHQPGTEEWFDEERRIIFSERSILCGNGEVIRPDRVIIENNVVTVVDFKFGMEERARHYRQVLYYMDQLDKMGHREVRGYLWYMKLGRTIKVERS